MGDKIFKVRDPVYGFVELDQQEWDIINHPVYQRLRRIKQLSLTDMVYPGATHTRFEHSLGVMQMATDIYESIIAKPRATEILSTYYHLNNTGFDHYRKVIRLAALLHDIGHSPFSHSGENLMPLIDGEDTKRYSHEDYSIAIIKNMFRALIEDHPINANLHIDTEEVTALLGDKNPASFQGILLLFKEIISGQLDADRADYLLRDSIHTGVNYGSYDRNRFVACIDIGVTEEDSPVIAMQSGGWHIAESLVLARYQMFSQVYFHKTRRIYDHHISFAVKEILNDMFPDSDGTYPSLDKLEDYAKLDDWNMFGRLKDGKGGKHGEIIINRNHYRKKFETSLIPTEAEEEELAKIIEDLKQKNKNFVEDEATTKWYKLDKNIWIIDNTTKKVKELSELSSIVKSMVDAPRQKRLYVEKE